MDYDVRVCRQLDERGVVCLSVCALERRTWGKRG